jgi:hypothetical protein
VHARTQLRKAFKARLIAANVAGGAVYTHDPRGAVGFNRFPFVLIEPGSESKITVSGARKFSQDASRSDNRRVGRLMYRNTQLSTTVIAKETGTEDEFGNMVDVDMDADEAADAIQAEIEAALFDADNRLMTKDANGNDILLGEKELVLHGTGGLMNPETGSREIGCVHALWEALILTSEGDPETIIGGPNRNQ